MLDPRSRDDRVEPPEAFERGIDHGAIARARREVRVGEVDAVDGPAVGFEPRGDRGADPAGRAGDEHDAAHPT